MQRAAYDIGSRFTSVAVCEWTSEESERASGSACQFSEVMNESGCVCANVYCKGSETKNKVPSLSRIGGRFIMTIFKPISRPTAVTPEITSTLDGTSLLCSSTMGLGAYSRKGVT